MIKLAAPVPVITAEDVAFISPAEPTSGKRYTL